MHVLLGLGERVTLRHATFAAYYRRVRAGLLAALKRGEATEPYPVDHCALCEFRQVCDERWAQEDHLSLVAGIRRGQVTRLRSAGIGTLTQLAHAPATPMPHVASHTFENLHDQAGLQLVRKTTGKLDWHPLASEPGRGFERLPRPSPGDVIFDIEGDPFWEPSRGLHFLFGLLTLDGGYRAIWAHDRAGERQAFEELIDLLHERLARHPDMHVYHYGAYEPTALKQLMGVYATREDAVDAAAPRGLRRSAFGRAPGPAGGRAGVLAEGCRGAARLPPPGARHERHARRAGLRRMDAHARSCAARGDRGLQRGRLPRDARAARLADRAPARRRGLGRAPRSAPGRRRPAEGRRSARGAAAGAARGRDPTNA